MEVAERAGAARSLLVQRASEIPWNELAGLSVLGLSAGASAPEVLVERVIAPLKAWGADEIYAGQGRAEKVVFSLPKQLITK